MSKQKAIRDIVTRHVLNSSGNFCIEVEVILNDGTRAHESSPSGTTVGKYDAKLLSFEEIEKVTPILRKTLIGLSAIDQIGIDESLDTCLGVESGRIRGANLSSATSMAVCRACSKSLNIPLYKYIADTFYTTPQIPQIMANILNGGAHAYNNLPITEFMLLTKNCNARDAIAYGVSVYQELATIIKNKYDDSSLYMGKEGGYAPPLDDPQEAIEIMSIAIDRSGSNSSVSIGLDVAAGNLYDQETRKYKFGNKFLPTEDLINYYLSIVERNPKLVYLEDPLNEDQTTDWSKLHQHLPSVSIAGDDFVSTCSDRLAQILPSKCIDTIVLKINQCGTVSKLVNCFRLAHANLLSTVLSQRSNETDSNFLTHLAVGLGSDYLKAGAFARERIIKYNSLLRIAETIQAI